MEEQRAYHPPSFGGWNSIIVYAGGNALSIAVFLILYQIAGVFSDFRDPMLYALLCSIALRGPKDWIVKHLDAKLSQNRTLLRMALSTFLLPYTSIKDVVLECQSLLSRWMQAAAALREEEQRRLARKKTTTSGTLSPSSTAPPPSAIPSALMAYYSAGIQTLKARKDKRRRKKRANSHLHASAAKAPTGDLLLLWLFRVCIAWAVYEWIRDSWSPTVKILGFTGVATVAALAAPLTYLTSSSHPHNNGPLSPVKTPATPRETQFASSTKLVQRGLALLNTSPQTVGTNTLTTTGELSPRRLERLRKVPSRVTSLYFSCDGWIRGTLRSMLHSLVTLALVLCVLVGTSGTTAFLSAKIVQEGRGVVLAARHAVPAAWANVAAGAPQSPDSLPAWLVTYQRDAVELMQRSLPGMASWLETQFQGFLDSHNLTHALGDVRLLYESVQGHRECSEEERQKLLVALAKAEVGASSASQLADEEKNKLDSYQQALQQALKALDDASACISSSEDQVATSCQSATPEMWAVVVHADQQVQLAREMFKEASLRADKAKKSRRVADARLQLCITSSSDTAIGDLLVGMDGTKSTRVATVTTHGSGGGGLARELEERLQSAYNKLWRRQLREGALELKQAALYAFKNVTHKTGESGSVNATSTSTSMMQDLPALLSRLVSIAAVPLIAIGRAMAGSLGSTTAAAVMGSMGLLRLGLGVVNLGLQIVLFITLLYYLLAAEKDPLTRAAAHLPLSDAGKQRAAAVINKALGGVFMSMLKMAALHALLTWVTYRALTVPLVYTSAVASAAFSLLPFVPTYAVAIPGAAVLAVQGRVAAAVLLFLVHFGSYWVGDTLVLEQAGDPMVVSLAILGGLWAFSNPLLGCILGPILLSLLSAIGSLLADLLASESARSAWGATARAPTAVTIPPLRLTPVTQPSVGMYKGNGVAPDGAQQPPALQAEEEVEDEEEVGESNQASDGEESSLQSFSFTKDVRRKLHDE